MVGGIGTPWRQRYEGTFQFGGGAITEDSAFYRRDELSDGKGSDPKLVRFPWFSFFLAGSHK